MSRVSLFLFLFSVLSSVKCQQTLPNTTIPFHYTITIEPSLSDLTFLGQIVITASVTKETETFVLNAKNLNISAAELYKWSDKSTQDIIDTLSKDDSETITFNMNFEEGIYDLKLTYAGEINQNFDGLYVSKYAKTSGNSKTERQFLLTNFQFSKARQAFPCFDHPSFPATFAINIVRSSDYISLSNMALKSQTNLGDDRILDQFAASDAIPTYLVSFAVIDFDRISTDLVSVYSVETENADLMIELSSEAFEKFKQAYPHRLNKIDYVVVPDESLPKNALESVGLIIYRKSAVQFNEATHSTEEKQSMLKLITHAVVKQCYNKVDTSNWWTHFWLNEGILMFYQYEMCSAIRPEWELLEQFVVRDFHKALRLEEEGNEIALVIEDVILNDLSETFYTKAFSLIRTASNLKLPGDLTDDSEDSVPYSWAKFKGFPVLSATRDYEANTIAFSQESWTSTWTIPINVASKDLQNFDDTQFDYLLNEDEMEINSSLVAHTENSWYIVNKKQIGYYRVDYGDENNWHLILNYLNTNDFNTIHPINRAQLLDDSFSLGDSESTEEFDYDIYLKMLSYVEREEDYIPLVTFFETTNRLKSLLANTEAQTKFLNFSRRLVSDLYAKVGIEIKSSDSHIDRLKRVSVLTWMCNFEDETCQRDMYAKLAINESIHPDLQEPVYCGGMRLGKLENFVFLLDQYKLSGNSRILKGMGCTSDTDILRRYLEGAIGTSTVVRLNTKDRVLAFMAVIEGSNEGVDVALDFIKQNFETIFNDFGDSEISQIFTELSKNLFTAEQETKINQTIDCLTDDQKTKYQSLFAKVQENIKVNQEWRNVNLDDINSWLDSQTSTTTTSAATTNRPTTKNETTGSSTDKPRPTTRPPTTRSPPTTTTNNDTTTSSTVDPDKGGAAALKTDFLINFIASLIFVVIFMRN